MLDAKLTKIGTLTIEGTKMHAIGFDTDKPMMCRELAAHVCVWAIGQLQEELARILAAPGGTMAVDDACWHCGKNEVHGLTEEDCPLAAAGPAESAIECRMTEDEIAAIEAACSNRAPLTHHFMDLTSACITNATIADLYIPSQSTQDSNQ